MQFHEADQTSIFLDGLILIESIDDELQRIKLYEHPFLGKVLIINDEIQHIERYQAFYHELLVHLPTAFLPEIKSAYIIGGGSLFAAYELLKYPTIQKVVLCDYDRNVLDLMKRHYSHARIVINDPRFEYIEKDAIEALESKDHKYDLVINDCFNLISESKRIGESLYDKMLDICSECGVCVDIIYRHLFDSSVIKESLSELQKQHHLVMSLVVVPEYPGVLHLETIWGKNANISQNAKRTYNEYQKAIINEADSPFLLFQPQNLSFYMYLPPYLKNLL